MEQSNSPKRMILRNWNILISIVKADWLEWAKFLDLTDGVKWFDPQGKQFYPPGGGPCLTLFVPFCFNICCSQILILSLISFWPQNYSPAPDLAPNPAPNSAFNPSLNSASHSTLDRAFNSVTDGTLDSAPNSASDWIPNPAANGKPDLASNQAPDSAHGPAPTGTFNLAANPAFNSHGFSSWPGFKPKLIKLPIKQPTRLPV